MDNIFTIADASRNDFREFVSEVSHSGIRTWVFDPPYNIGFDYGGVITDKSEYYESEIKNMAVNMRLHSKYHANMFLVIYPAIASRLLPAHWIVTGKHKSLET